jgi:hypothetical protein
MVGGGTVDGMYYRGGYFQFKCGNLNVSFDRKTVMESCPAYVPLPENAFYIYFNG